MAGHVICVRDVVRAATHTLGANVLALRVPYDLFKPAGPVVRRGDRIAWQQDEQSHLTRYAATALADCVPGERVLLQLPPRSSDDEWWLCEVQSVDDVAGLS
jgi:hypothetical protein